MMSLGRKTSVDSGVKDSAVGVVGSIATRPIQSLPMPSSSQSMSPMLSLGSLSSPCSFVFEAPRAPALRTTSYSAHASSSSALSIWPSPSAPPSLSAATQGKNKPRKDAPEVYGKVRGCKRTGLEIARGPDRLRSAIARYEKDEKSSGDTSEFSIRTLREFHDGVDWSNFGSDAHEDVSPSLPSRLRSWGVS